MSSDPRQGGLIGGLYGLNSGAYDARIKKRQDELNVQRSFNQKLNDQSTSLKNEAQLRYQELALEQQHLNSMESDISALESDVSYLNAKSDKQKSEIASFKKKINDQKKKLKKQHDTIAELNASSGSNLDPKRYQMLKQERDHLYEEYKKLLEYWKNLSDATNN